MFSTILIAVWLMLPAYVANAFAVLTGGGKSIDFEKNFLDGKRIFGNGKTWNGLIGGIIVGMFTGSVQNVLLPSFVLFPLIVLFCLTFGALFGDLCKSFIKRRLDIESGSKVPVMDQLDFVLGAWLFLILFAYPWFSENFTSYHVIVILIMTPFLHRITNIIGYKLGKKDVPW
ncbi:MAG: CDP-2,3-bis-(O-geranylgeranyl)-sn-glycerol synthase [Methanocellales archaeon]|nr:CDP-2,3-bis-(O-geranylgeranyl)-sn-glycerol synthase [Methanocellales archaeon]MDD3291727.1 CDP-2,3-bis-(O-geranylgeranyl)-sn-glycerol synthase [Methanocellales archaeon]MDD5235077.1 CDP-2,3-bis-(O-geranylgeranyl)-sn-glycerol synthase [Methanocellales archaeon]MDD5485215.1 CDP-2,3-bis-(O-geranylgeranyl)-sn-glycerol synthase [Methanocellales archaeon]